MANKTVLSAFDNCQGGRGHWAGSSLIPKVFSDVFLFDDFSDFHYIMIFWFIKLSVHTFQPLKEIYRMGNLVHNH